MNPFDLHRLGLPEELLRALGGDAVTEADALAAAEEALGVAVETPLPRFFLGAGGLDLYNLRLCFACRFRLPYKNNWGG